MSLDSEDWMAMDMFILCTYSFPKYKDLCVQMKKNVKIKAHIINPY